MEETQKLLDHFTGISIPGKEKNNLPASISTAGSDGFVSLDIGKLSMVVTSDKDKDSTKSPHATNFQKHLSRKGSMRLGIVGGSSGGEEKNSTVAEGEAVIPSTGSAEKVSGVLVHVAGEGEGWTVPHAMTPTSAGRLRRSVGRRPAPWLDPRRVVLVFAALSSMGTLILLYFTLSMGKMPGGEDANAR